VATFSAVTRQHLLQAIAEYDSRGGDDFLGVYGFEPCADYPLVHEGRSYDSRAVLGVAHRYATGRLAAADEFGDGMAAAAAVLRKRGFDVTEPASEGWVAPARTAARSATARRTSASRTVAPRRVAVREPVMAVCPSCWSVLPATGICDCS
jgi:hypothetical protein